MPSRDVNAKTRLAEASWRRDNCKSITSECINFEHFIVCMSGL